MRATDICVLCVHSVCGVFLGTYPACRVTFTLSAENAPEGEPSSSSRVFRPGESEGGSASRVWAQESSAFCFVTNYMH